MKQKTVTSKNAEETKEFAAQFIANLKDTNLIALYGELGSGKTTFVQGLAVGLGIKKRIISPTFIIVRSYKLRTKNPELITFYHIDLYRINEQTELEGLGIEEILNDEASIVAIEWAEKMGDLLPKHRIDVNFEYLSENEREITIARKD